MKLTIINYFSVLKECNYPNLKLNFVGNLEEIMQILIAEDEIDLANSLKKNFMDEGYHCTLAEDGEKALELLDKLQFDIILLDWRMPKITGDDVCREIRNRGIDTPIILLTALKDISNKVKALDFGADDYITKPFSFREVLARINAIRRRMKFEDNELVFDRFSLDLINREVIKGNLRLKLTEKEFLLLKYLITHANSVISKEQLLDQVWELGDLHSTNVIEVTVKKLRNKLEIFCERNFIKTIYGEGYLFVK